MKLDAVVSRAGLQRLLDVAYDALERYARGAPCLKCEATGVVLAADPTKEHLRSWPENGRVKMRAHCVTCEGRGWVVVTKGNLDGG